MSQSMFRGMLVYKEKIFGDSIKYEHLGNFKLNPHPTPSPLECIVQMNINTIRL